MAWDVTQLDSTVIHAIANTVAQIKCGRAGFLCALSSGNFDVQVSRYTGSVTAG